MASWLDASEPAPQLNPNNSPLVNVGGGGERSGIGCGVSVCLCN
jgi:hypothetical protein